MVRAVNELDRCRSSTSETPPARRWIILLVHSPFSKVRMDRDALRESLRFSERDGSEGEKREREGSRTFTSAVLVFCVIAEEICVASVVRAIRESSRRRACGRTGAYPYCYGYISGCLSCKKGLGSSLYVGRLRYLRLFYIHSSRRWTRKFLCSSDLYFEL